MEQLLTHMILVLMPMSIVGIFASAFKKQTMSRSSATSHQPWVSPHCKNPERTQGQNHRMERRRLNLKDEVMNEGRRCDCIDCEPELYFGDGCCREDHQEADLAIEDGKRPTLRFDEEISLSVARRYEALQVAHAAIESFTRKEEAMHPMQRQSLNKFRRLVKKKELVQKFDRPDASEQLSVAYIHKLIELLNDIFFLGAISPVAFFWEKQNLRDRIACCRWFSTGQREYHQILMHPTTNHYGVSSKPQAANRIGSLLHEMVHAFVTEFACRECETFDMNAVGHGRAWQLLAKAIEDSAPQLLHVDVEMDRLLCLNGELRWHFEARKKRRERSFVDTDDQPACKKPESSSKTIIKDLPKVERLHPPQLEEPKGSKGEATKLPKGKGKCQDVKSQKGSSDDKDEEFDCEEAGPPWHRNAKYSHSDEAGPSSYNTNSPFTDPSRFSSKNASNKGITSGYAAPYKPEADQDISDNAPELTQDNQDSLLMAFRRKRRYPPQPQTPLPSVHDLKKWGFWE